LEDRYYLQKVKLGQGSFGTVWRAVDRHSNRVVAIKQLDKAAMPRRGVRQQDIEREVNVMQAVVHENITQLLSTFEDRGHIYLALEYCDGGDFGDKVKERGLHLTEPEASDWMRQVLSAIAALHAKAICHRDIKPDNFMVHANTVKLADFGLALFLPRGRLLTEKCGTPAFMCPEQHKLPRGSRGYTNLCDVWAAGVTMYMLMFGGRHPFLTSSQQIDEKRLLGGHLCFSVDLGLCGFGLGGGEGRFSEPARRLCKRLV
jgi:serine/threonine protein kinase